MSTPAMYDIPTIIKGDEWISHSSSSSTGIGTISSGPSSNKPDLAIQILPYHRSVVY